MMKGSFFLNMDDLTPERLSWLVEILKYYCTRLHPESLHHHPRIQTPPFTFFISGDACYSLLDHRCLHYWEILFRLPPFQCVCDAREIRLRGIPIEPLKMKNPDQIINAGSSPHGDGKPFWDMFLDMLPGEPDSGSLGVINVLSPYMHTSPLFLSNLLYAAVNQNLSPELYGYLDGVYAMHANQQPILSGNIGELLNSVHIIAMKKGLSPLFLASACCATDRGYSTFTDKRKRIISSCTIPPVKICNLERIISRLRKNHQIVSSSSFSIQLENNSRILPNWVSGEKDPPPLVILATQSPYGKEMIYGAFSLALASAAQDIVTRVVFIENGVYTLTGHHELSKDEPMFQMQELVEVMADTDNLELYSYTPSLFQRGVHVSSSIRHVLPVNSPELSQIMLQAPAGIETRFQRIFIF